MLELLVEHDLVLEHPQLAVDLHAQEALGAQLLERLAVLALAPAHDRREDHEARALLELHDLVDDLLGRLAGDRLAAVVAVRLADARPQQAQVVVDLGDRADRRPRVARRRLLVDRDRRRQALDRVDVRLVHLAEELARVGAQRLDVAALALGVDRVERERRLARARQAGDDHQRVAREARAMTSLRLCSRAPETTIAFFGGIGLIVAARTDVRGRGGPQRVSRRTVVRNVRRAGFETAPRPVWRRSPEYWKESFAPTDGESHVYQATWRSRSVRRCADHAAEDRLQLRGLATLRGLPPQVLRRAAGARRPAELGDGHRQRAVAVAVHDAPRPPDEPHDVRDQARVRVDGGLVEQPARAGVVEGLERLRAAVGQPGEHDARARVGGLERRAPGAQQLHVALGPRLGAPEPLEVRLAPDLPRADGPPRRGRELLPQRPPRAVAADERAQERLVGRQVGRRRPEVGPRRRPARRADHDGQHVEAGGGGGAHDAVHRPQVRRAGRRLQVDPVHGHAHEAQPVAAHEPHLALDRDAVAQHRAVQHDAEEGARGLLGARGLRRAGGQEHEEEGEDDRRQGDPGRRVRAPVRAREHERAPW